MDKDDQKDDLFKRLKNNEDKNEELPNVLSEVINVGNNANYESNFHYDPTLNFRRFNRDFKKFKNMTLLEYNI